MSEVRHRKKKASSITPPLKSQKDFVTPSKQKISKAVGELSDQDDHCYQLAFAVVTILAFVTRFWMINFPSEVVTYFFDLHPPFAKLLIAAVGKLVGYDGSFKFDNIGDSYITNKVPYVAYRALSASLGAFTVPIVFLIMKESGYSVYACTVAASLILFDNAHIGETRLILLDATLIYSVALSVYCYVRFSKQRRTPFSYDWWKWLLLTGVSLSCVISTKYVGTFTFVTIGSAVAVDLWNLLDYHAGLTMKQFSKHFVARFFALILLPLAIFLFWFWVHFTILSNSGPGDGFMSPEFQETLGENVLLKEAKQINYYDVVTLKHKDIGAFLHSHDAKYPLRYDDGRISSQGQQVTGYVHPDFNNQWQILPSVDYPEDERLGIPVFGGSTIRLLHVATNTVLLTHDVASPTYPTNQEFTTVTIEDAEGPRYNDTLFELRMNSGKNDLLKTKAGLLRLIHVPTKVAMWTHIRPLPEWGFGQLEINGNKNNADTSNIWYFDEIVGLDDEERLNPAHKQVKTLPFFKKYWELQMLMFAQNNALTSSHPYASEPISWPFIFRGVSFWTSDPGRNQIYFHGNFFGWWLEICLISVYLGIVAADQLGRRRNVNALDDHARSKLYFSGGFFFIGWAAHYFPFFLMSRQKFLHHYLPAHLLASLLAACVIDFIAGTFDERDPREPAPSHKTYAIATAIILLALVASFVYFAPLTYGWPGLTVEQVHAREWMKMDLHFSK